MKSLSEIIGEITKQCEHALQPLQSTEQWQDESKKLGQLVATNWTFINDTLRWRDVKEELPECDHETETDDDVTYHDSEICEVKVWPLHYQRINFESIHRERAFLRNNKWYSDDDEGAREINGVIEWRHEIP